MHETMIKIINREMLSSVPNLHTNYHLSKTYTYGICHQGQYDGISDSNDSALTYIYILYSVYTYIRSVGATTRFSTTPF